MELQLGEPYLTLFDKHLPNSKVVVYVAETKGVIFAVTINAS